MLAVLAAAGGFALGELQAQTRVTAAESDKRVADANAGAIMTSAWEQRSEYNRKLAAWRHAFHLADTRFALALHGSQLQEFIYALGQNATVTTVNAATKRLLDNLESASTQIKQYNPKLAESLMKRRRSVELVLDRGTAGAMVLGGIGSLKTILRSHAIQTGAGIVGMDRGTPKRAPASWNG